MVFKKLKRTINNKAMYTTLSTQEGFIYAIIPNDEAQEIFYSGSVELYEYFEEEETEALIESQMHLETVIEFQAHTFGLHIVIEVGDADELSADYQEAVARNNDNRGFEQWLDDKISLILE